MLPRASQDALIQKNLGLVRALAAKVAARCTVRHDLEELVSFGSEGLVEAARRYDPARGVAFTTFAYYRIYGAIYDGIRQQGWMPRQRQLRCDEACNEYLGELAEVSATPAAPRQGGAARAAALADTLGDLATIFVSTLGAASPADSPPARAGDALRQVEARQTREAVNRAVAALPPKERQLIQLHYFQEQSLQDAGKALGMSKSWASRLHARAIRLMARQLRHMAE